jgi:hypothetical protein
MFLLLCKCSCPVRYPHSHPPVNCSTAIDRYRFQTKSFPVQQVVLREDVCELSVAPGQEGFVTPNWYSITEASFGTELFLMAILRGDGRMVGFLMYGWDSC